MKYVLFLHFLFIIFPLLFIDILNNSMFLYFCYFSSFFCYFSHFSFFIFSIFHFFYFFIFSCYFFVIFCYFLLNCTLHILYMQVIHGHVDVILPFFAIFAIFDHFYHHFSSFFVIFDYIVSTRNETNVYTVLPHQMSISSFFVIFTIFDQKLTRK